MSGPELRVYNYTQRRIIRNYHSHVHPELTVNEVAMIWIPKYAEKFQKWWEKSAKLAYKKT